MVKNKAVYIALGVTREGVREVLGLWIAENGGAQILALDDERVEKLRTSGHIDRGGRRAAPNLWGSGRRQAAAQLDAFEEKWAGL